MPLPAIAGLRPDATLEEVKTKINSLIEEFRQLLLSLDSLNVPSLVASYISTADGMYPRIDFSASGNILQAYQDALNWIAFNPNLTGSPTIQIHNGNDNRDSFISYIADIFSILAQTGDFQISAQNGNLTLNVGSGKSIKIPSWSAVLNQSSGRTLQQDLDSKASSSSASGTVYVSSTSGGPANIPITFSNGVRTS